MYRLLPRSILLACYFGLAIPAAGATVLATDGDSITKCWSFEYGVAFITSENIGELLSGTVHFDKGPAGGEIHMFTAARLLAEPEWVLFGKTFRPVIELPLTLAVFDENARAPFADYNASLRVRWRDFPWNHLITTTFATGVGFSYSSKIPAMDQQRHPDSKRSHLKFDWPIQLSLAHPAHPEHQLTLFIAHQSGGKLFDQGGINSIGLGYRFARW